MKTFVVKVKTVKKIGKSDVAECIPLQNKKFKELFGIRVSTNQNHTLLKFLQSLIHELVHLAFYVIKNVFNYQVEGRSEHKFIERIEESVATNFYLLKQRKKK